MARYTAEQLAGLPLGPEVYQALSRQLGGFVDPRGMADSIEWAAPEYVMQGESSPLLGPNALPRADIMEQLGQYSFDWNPGGYGASGTLSAFDEGGQQVGSFRQKDQSDLQSLAELGMLAGAAFGGLGLAGAGPFAGMFGSPAAAGGLGGGGNAAFGALEGLGTLGGGGNALASAVGLPMGLEGVSFGGGLSMPSGFSLGGAMGGIGDALGGIGSKIGSAIGNMSGGDWLKLGGNLLSAGLESRGIGKAADAQMAAAQQANDLMRAIYEQNRADTAPWRQAGAASLGRLQEMLGLSGNAQAPGFGSLMQGFTGADVANEPGYQFGLSEGQKGIERAANAAGRQYSGATLKALQRYGQDYAGTKFNEAFQRDTATKNRLFNQLSGVAGTGQTATQAIGSQGMGMAGQIGQNLMGAGNVAGSSALARGNLLADLLNQGMSSWNRRSGGGRAGIGVPTSPEGWY